MTHPTSLALASPAVLGIECGGTRSVALFVDGPHAREWNGGPANLRLLDDTRLRRHLRSIARTFSAPSAIAIGMAGARTEADWQRIRVAAAKVWPRVPCLATNDLETALAAGASPANGASVRVLVLSGTGSCCYGRAQDGRTAKMGGWGHLLGDKGSGYEIGLRALKAVIFYFDRDGNWSRLGQRLLRTLQLNEPEDLIGWVQAAGKSDIAALAVEVFAAAAERDRVAADILEGAAHSLAKDAVSCAGKLARTEQPVEFVFAGSVLLKQLKYARRVRRLIKERWPAASSAPLKRSSVWGAVELARKLFADSCRSRREEAQFKSEVQDPNSEIEPSLLTSAPTVRDEAALLPWDVRQIAASPTERRNPRSRNLDKLSTSAAIKLMLSEDARIPAALLREQSRIAWAVERIARAFRRGGRLFYAGAGTSGRLGVLDASECPPTFRADPEMVQAIMAGGQRALWMPVEGAEDDPDAGAAAVKFRGVRRGDVFVGIAASGRTPFVWGALREAKRRRATTILLCFNPALTLRKADQPHCIITPDLGPEVLTGSTRLKAGTATKLILNVFTTLAMVRIGKVMSNLMVDLHPTNVKLRDRAARIVRQLTGTDERAARQALERSGWVIKTAVGRLQRAMKSLPRRRSGN